MSHKKLWTDDEWAAAQRLRAEGHTMAGVAARIGRGINGVKAKFQWEAMTSDQREARAARIFGYKKAWRDRQSSYRPKEQVTKTLRPPDEIIHDREARHAAGPRDLTGAFFGDPPRGYSALERRA